MFKGLFDLQDEGIIKDFLKDDHHVQIRDSVRNVLKNDKIEKEITNNEDLLNAFKKYIKEALSGHGCNTQTIEDYIDMALAIQEIYYKNPENIHCDEEGVILIEKAKVKIERKPYVLTVSKI